MQFLKLFGHSNVSNDTEGQLIRSHKLIQKLTTKGDKYLRR
jgi:hypothetical protein